MKKKFFLQLAVWALALLQGVPAFAQEESVVTLSGNAYITAGKTAHIDEAQCAVQNWSDKETVISFYFRAQQSGKMKLALQAKGNSSIEVSLLGKKKKVTLNSDTLTRVDLGTFKVKTPGYIKMDIQGVKINGGSDFGSIASVLVGGKVSPVVRVAPDFSTHFGRRGPSVHLGYTLPREDVEWFYNEVVVPEEGDIPSSYYMACGFGQGYFGMQNNSPYKRRVLFSVWSPFVTDNPSEIPDSLRVTLIKKGADVTINDFGNEGSGGQSFMHYDWKAGERCRFLMGVKPDGQGNTIYTAYFYDNHKGKWSLVASFRRPQITTWYTNAHSFLENFNPVMGHINRKAYYGNQWARTTEGRWIPVTKARFTCDTTGHQQMRLDYTGGVEGENFFLSMGGFFDEYMKTGTYFERTGNTTEAPDIDFSTLE
ncbi:MAG: DUF3472 domain-containing protein [Bacteroidaceae bacterium]|nr:DUF3472 domain-containing protein [Bacteroidaceae bacterium]